MRIVALIAALLAAFVAGFDCEQDILEIRFVAVAPGEPSLNGPKVSEQSCVHCEHFRVKLSNREIDVLAERDPSVVLTTSDLDRVLVGKLDDELEKSSYWLVVAVPIESTRKRLQAITNEHPFERLVVSRGGVPIALENTATWTHGIALGSFLTRSEAEQLASGFGLPVELSPRDTE